MKAHAPIEGEHRFGGVVASPGLASGRLVVLAPAAGGAGVLPPAGDAATERARLDRAVSAAVAELEELMAGLDDDEAAGIVAFQSAMLEDESFLEPVHESIAAGRAAHAAWDAAMAEAIAGYESADDAYFRARAADLADIRDRVADRLAGRVRDAIPAGSIVVADELTPTRFLAASWEGSGIALTGGSTTGHVAILARARGVPMLVGVPMPDARSGDALLDADDGVLIVAPEKTTLRAFEERRVAARLRAEQEAAFLPRPATTASGERVMVGVNLAGPDDVAAIDAATCDGSGLVRTEFLFDASGGEPGEETQLAAYRRIVDWAAGRPVTFRTLDAGGDKPIPGITVDGEANPFLGQRGIRLSLLRPEILVVQLRALLRAAAHGPVKIMLPMVTVPEEVRAVRGLLERARRELAVEGLAAGEAKLGIMVEVPAAAFAIDTFQIDFLSIGTNDLVQYMTAASRDNGALGHLARPDNPAVLRLIAHVARHAADHGIEAGVCGDMAGDPRYIPMLLECGVRSFSVAPAALARIKAAIARWGG